MNRLNSQLNMKTKQYLALAGAGFLAGCSALAQTPRADANGTADDLASLRQKARMGDAAAQTRLGRRYEFGVGVAPNESEAVRWYRRAAEQGNAAGQYWLGRALAGGRGVLRNRLEAVRWFRLAAAQDFAPARNALGRMYEEGHGVPKDLVQAHRWYTSASEVYSEANRLALQRRMTTEQIVQASSAPLPAIAQSSGTEDE